jgi:AcrR family transcriptional regulator
MPRQGLTRTKVLRAAFDIVDEHGLAELTMRRLGQHLGVEAPSLYKHITGKADILDGITGLVYDEIEFEDIGGSFRDRVQQYSQSFRRALLRHPHVVPLLAMRPVPRAGTIGLVEMVLAAMADLGFPPSEGRKYLNVAFGFIVGHALSEVGARQVGSDYIAQARRDFDDPEYPHARLLALEAVDYDGEFALGIDLIVDAVERRATAIASSEPAATPAGEVRR